MSKPNISEISDEMQWYIKNNISDQVLLAATLASEAAKDSKLKNFKTGSTVFNTDPKDIRFITGTSEVSSDGGSIHAEEACVFSLGDNALADFDSCFVFTRNKAGNIANNSKPCAACVKKLYKSNIMWVYYFTVENYTNLSLVISSVEEMYEASKNVKHHKYAKLMRF